MVYLGSQLRVSLGCNQDQPVPLFLFEPLGSLSSSQLLAELNTLN